MKKFADAKSALIEHLKAHALRTDGPFQLSSGGTSAWYLDGRQTTFDGNGGRVVGSCVNAVLDPTVTAVGGLTMGADPIAIATALVAETPLRAFSIRKEVKHHGAGGRLVGPVRPDDRIAIVDDTTTTGASFVQAMDVLSEVGIEVVQAIVLVDRSAGRVGAWFETSGVPFTALVTPADLGVETAAAEAM